MNQVVDVLQNYSQPDAPRAEGDVAGHYQQVAKAAPPSDLAGGLAAMFHSDQTPPFAQMIGQLFSNSNGAQRANLLNTLLSSGAGAGILGQLGPTVPDRVRVGEAIVAVRRRGRGLWQHRLKALCR